MKTVAHKEIANFASAKAVVVFAMLAAALLAAALVVPGKAFAANEVHLQDGQTYDLSQVESATCVYVETSGTFKFIGSSSLVFVDVQVPEGQSATIVLDGVTLTPGADASGGSDDGCSAISIKDTDNGGGQVALVSASASRSLISGYGNKPAIQKSGTKTKLVFKTEDPNNPGEIQARASDASFRTCGIGAYGSHSKSVSDTAGNIVFESGDIVAYGSTGGSSDSGGAGIGANAGAFVDGITIKGGSVTAVAGDWSAAAIGTSSADLTYLPNSASSITVAPRDAKNISIEGGTVIAKHVDGSAGEGGAGIGGGYGCTANGVSISGGDVYAEGSTGIGGGSDGDGLNIAITGGNVEACGRFTGIGGGKSTGPVAGNAETWFGEATVDISGGNVKAYCVAVSGAGVGIGGWKSCVSGSENLNGRGHVFVSGGTVWAKGALGLAGIGTGSCGSLEYISITGGQVYAEGGSEDGASAAPGIGMPQDMPSHSQVKRISISGGTVAAVASGNAGYSIGAYSNGFTSGQKAATQVYISGGNIKASLGFNVVPKQSANGEDVSLCKVDTETYGQESDLTDRTVSKLAIHDVSNGGYEVVPYGYNDMHPFMGSSAATYYLWLPSCDEKALELRVSPECDNMRHHDAEFSGISKDAAALCVYPRTQVKLVADPAGEQGENGSAVFAQGLDTIDYKRTVREGKELVGYSLSSDGSNMVLDAQGKLIPNAVVDGAAFADAYGRFAGSSESRYKNFVLYAQWRDTGGVVQFDSNKPSGANAPVIGGMEDKNIDAGDRLLLDKEPSLAGYSFTGWNTKPDGSGVVYNADDYVEITEIGQVVTLYAQWKKNDYLITFSPNGGELESGKPSYSQVAYFGNGATLDTPAMRFQWHHQTGWNTDPDGTGVAYRVGASVPDLAKAGGEAVYLYAQWDADTYTVKFDGNGSQGSMNAAKFECGIAHLLPNRGFVYEGRAFVGWNTASDGSGKSFAPEATYADLAGAGESVTLYAQWEGGEPEPTPEPDPKPGPEDPGSGSDPAPEQQPSPDVDGNVDGSDVQQQDDVDGKQALADTGDSSMSIMAVLSVVALASVLSIALLRRRARSC